jgi:VWFA-related protein
VVLAFEQLSTEGRHVAASGALRFVEEGMRPDDLVAVVAIDRALHFLVLYALDREAVKRGIKQAALGPGYPLEQPGRVPGAEWRAGESASAATTAESPYIRAHATIDALRSLVTSLRAPQGRRVIVLFSEGLALGKPKDQQPVNPSFSPHDREEWLYDNRFDAMDHLTKEAGREGVTFYTFDARGLRVAENPAGLGEAPYIGLKFLADETGGAFVEATSDLATGMQRLAADLQSYQSARIHRTQRP